MRILVDLDGIVTDTLPAWLKRIHELTGIYVKPSDITKWNLNENSGLARLDPKVLFDILNEPGFNRNLTQMADASYYLHHLHNQGHEIYLVTARFGSICRAETVEWVKALMPWLNVEKNLGFWYDKHHIVADMLIDDKAETLIAYQKAHPLAHLVTIDYPYNKHAPDCTHRVPKDGYEWEAIESYITKLTRKPDDL